MGDRVVYCARLESVCALIGTGGSNPPPSARLPKHRPLGVAPGIQAVSEPFHRLIPSKRRKCPVSAPARVCAMDRVETVGTKLANINSKV